MLTLTLALSLIGAPQVAAAPPPATSSKDVVVTGHRLSDSAAALAACIARHCPPDQDIAATLAHAENQFVAGDYGNARRTLLASKRRNRRFAHDYPIPVSDLMRANSRVAAHLGMGREYQIDTIDTLSAMRSGLSDNDPRVLAQRIEIGDMFAGVGRPDAAFPIFAEVGEQARKLGLSAIQGTARLHAVVLALQQGGNDLKSRSGDMHEALRDLDALAAEPDPKLAGFAMVARVIRAQYLAKHGDNRALDALIAEMRTRGLGKKPTLVYSPAIDLAPGDQRALFDNNPADDGLTLRNALARMPVGSFDHQWVDVSYWVKPDGSVSDVNVMRESKPNAKYWDAPILKAIAARRYLPMAMSADDPGVLRVERYTYTSRFDPNAVGTRVATRDGQPRVEMLDLTEQPAGKTEDTTG